MRRIRHFWYITTIDNLKSMLTYGILSRKKTRSINLTFEDISDGRVQQRRASYHDCVPLFFADNTPMLYKVFWSYRKNLCLLEISHRILERKNLKFCDGNIASSETGIYDSLSKIPAENWYIIFSNSPAYGIDSAGRNWKRIRAAEVLVPNRVPASLIKSISVPEQASCDTVERILRKLKKKISIYNNLTPQGRC